MGIYRSGPVASAAVYTECLNVRHCAYRVVLSFVGLVFETCCKVMVSACRCGESECKRVQIILYSTNEGGLNIRTIETLKWDKFSSQYICLFKDWPRDRPSTAFPSSGTFMKEAHTV